jgi:superfamily I DNA and/or RNA helicase
VEELLSFDIIVCTCHDAHILYQTGLTNQQLRMHRMQVESRTKIELAACGIQFDSIPAVHEPHFTHLFIDEAAQATEPESLIPLSVVVDPIAGSRKVEIALVGDPRQLSPQVYSSRAARASFNRSWMERLLRRPVQCLGGGDNAMLGPDMKNIDELLRYSFARDGHEQLSFFLTTNYRGHPSFLIMPSALFYVDKLHWASYDRANRNEDLASEWCGRLRHVEALSKPVIPRETTAQKRFDFPIHFRGVVGNDTSQTIKSGSISEESWTNEAEAKTVAEIVMTLTEEAGVGSQSIGVMAPFRGQVVLIRSLLRKKGLANINVGTIEDYQGIEKEVVVLSLTRSTDAFVPSDVDRRIGVFRQEKQSNVALTRAEQMQIVVGNPNIMAADPVWKQWLWFCLRNGLWYGDEGNTRTAFEKIDQLPTFPTLRPGSMEQKPSDDLDDYVVVSALEGILRNT